MPDGAIQVLRLLNRHADNSVTYIAHVSFDGHPRKGTYIARVFDGHMPPNVELLQRRPEAHGILVYDAVTAATLRGTENTRHERKVWMTLRQYARHTLAELIEKPVRLQRPMKAVSAVTDVAIGVRNLHDLGIIHGDLRPSNVIVHNNTEMRIVDYGLPPWSSRKSMPDYLTAWVAPEEFRPDRMPTRSADVYSFGKIARACLRVSKDTSRGDEQLLTLVIAECLRTAPDDRPTMQQIVAILGEQTSDFLATVNYEQYRQAVIADVDARIPNVVDEHLRTVSRSASEAIEAMARGVSEYSIDRAALLREPELVHFLATLSMTYLPKRVRITPKLANNGIIRAVQYKQYELLGNAESQPSENFLDSEWRSELEEIALGNKTSMLNATDEQKMLVQHQLAQAAELRAVVLQSDGFVRSQDVAAIMALACPGIIPAEVRILRDLGYLIGLPDRGITLYPLFQFDPITGLPLSCIKEVSDITQSGGSIWRRNVWWFIGTPRLEGMSPVEWLRKRRSQGAVVASYFDRFAA